MITIWKFTLDIVDKQVIKAPIIRLLHVQVQRDALRLWCIIDTEKAEKEMAVHIVGTGNPFEAYKRDDFYYAGTFQLYEGSFVGHVFIRKAGMN